jgi:hypothetical protein
MGLGAENHHTLGSLAESFFTLQPIHATLPGTEFARLQDCVGLFNLLNQFSFILQFLIGGSPRVFLFLIGAKRDGRAEKGAAKDDRTFKKISARYGHLEHPIARPLKNAPFCPISASDSDYNPRNTYRVFLWLKSSPSLTLNKIEHFSKVSMARATALFSRIEKNISLAFHLMVL